MKVEKKKPIGIRDEILGEPKKELDPLGKLRDSIPEDDTTTKKPRGRPPKDKKPDKEKESEASPGYEPLTLTEQAKLMDSLEIGGVIIMLTAFIAARLGPHWNATEKEIKDWEPSIKIVIERHGASIVKWLPEIVLSLNIAEWAWRNMGITIKEARKKAEDDKKRKEASQK